MRYAIKSKAGKYLYSGIKECIFVRDLFIAKCFKKKEAAERHAKKMNDAYYAWAKSEHRTDRNFPVHVIGVKMVEIETEESRHAEELAKRKDFQFIDNVRKNEKNE